MARGTAETERGEERCRLPGGRGCRLSVDRSEIEEVWGTRVGIAQLAGRNFAGADAEAAGRGRRL